MEDKSLERGVEKLAESILSEIETGPDGSYNHTKMLKVAEEVLKLYAKQENASLQDKLRVVEAENERHVQVLKTLCECSKCKNKFTSLSCPYCYCEEYKAENAALQSQITALKEESLALKKSSDVFEQAYQKLGLDYATNIRGYKAQVAGQAHYIKCLLDEVRELKERISEFVKGA